MSLLTASSTPSPARSSPRPPRLRRGRAPRLQRRHRPPPRADRAAPRRGRRRAAALHFARPRPAVRRPRRRAFAGRLLGRRRRPRHRPARDAAHRRSTRSRRPRAGRRRRRSGASSTRADPGARPGGHRRAHLDTGVGGLTLGSGSGWLERRHGLDARLAVGATVVTADGDVVHASEHEHPDLFWAPARRRRQLRHRHRVRVPLHEVGPIVLGGPAAVRVGARRRGAARLPRHHGRRPTTTSAAARCCSWRRRRRSCRPSWSAGRSVGIMVAAFGDARARGRRSSRRCGRSARSADAVAPDAVHRAAAADRRGQPAGLQGQFEAAFMDELSGDGDRRGARTSPRGIPSPFTVGAAAAARRRLRARARARHRARATATRAGATTRSRSGRIRPTRRQPRVDARASSRRWRRSPAAPPPELRLVGDRQERVRSFYGDETYARLVAVKDRWDPENVFRHNQNIMPSR